jgi:MoxR-like ATPase
VALEPNEIESKAKEFRQAYQRVKSEIQKVMVGHEEIIDGVLSIVFTGGHCLLEGVPGLGKTLLVRTLSEVLDLDFSRVQFTPDLMPADILGTDIVIEDDRGKRDFQFRKGPIFAQIVLADEINRATPKTQSALLEAMQEGFVTAGGVRHKLKQPFFVLATQNPIEQEGTYPLPEAQLDRFLMKLVVGYSSREDLSEIIDRTTGAQVQKPEKVMLGEEILRWRAFVREIIVSPEVKDYGIRLILATHPDGPFSTDMTNKYLGFGASPRGAQALILTAKLRALLNERWNVSFEDIREMALPVLRHRTILNFEGEAEGRSTDDIVKSILEEVPETEKGGVTA